MNNRDVSGQCSLITRTKCWLPAVSTVRRPGSMWAGRWRSAPTGPPSRWSARGARSRWTPSPVTGTGTALSTTRAESSGSTRTWGGGGTWWGLQGPALTDILPGENTPSPTMEPSWSVFTVVLELLAGLLTVLIELSASHLTWFLLCPWLPHL